MIWTANDGIENPGDGPGDPKGAYCDRVLADAVVTVYRPNAGDFGEIPGLLTEAALTNQDNSVVAPSFSVVRDEIAGKAVIDAQGMAAV